MRTVFAIIFFTLLYLLAGCTNSERTRASIFEGLKAREGFVEPQLEQRPDEKSITYQEYETERKKLLDNTCGK
jgi:hypothetical protein